MAYGYYRSVTIDESLCGTADSTDFPVTFTGTYAYLATVANGGKVENANGYDIAFFSDAGLTTPLDFELVTYTATTGFIEVHFRVGTLSSSTDTVIYVAYGDSGIGTFQGDVAGTWNSAFKGVYHLKDGTTLTPTDSTSGGNNGTALGGASAATGQIGGGAVFDGTGDAISLGSGVTTAIASLTISGWVKRTDTPGSYFMWYMHGADGSTGWAPYITSGNQHNFLKCSVAVVGSGVASASSAWEYVAWTVASDYKCELFVNGASVYASSATDAITTPSQRALIGSSQNSTESLQNSFIGSLDEIRYSNVVRSSSWITAEYNNQSSPSTFYTMGSEVSNGGTTIRPASDVTDGGWLNEAGTNTNLYASVDDNPTNDAQYVESPLVNAYNLAEIQLANPGGLPGAGAGTLTIRHRAVSRHGLATALETM